MGPRFLLFLTSVWRARTKCAKLCCALYSSFLVHPAGSIRAPETYASLRQSTHQAYVPKRIIFNLPEPLKHSLLELLDVQLFGNAISVVNEQLGLCLGHPLVK